MREAMPGWTTWWGPRPGAVAEAWQDYAASYAWFLGLQLLDILSTVAVLRLGGGEGNPVAADGYAQAGAGAFVGLKVVLIVLTFVVWLPCLAWIAVQPEARRRWALAAFHTGLVGCVVAYSLVVFHNLRNLSILLRGSAG